MKTNQVMKRPMGVFQVEQRTRDYMFNATALLKQWNENLPCFNAEHNSTYRKKTLSDFFASQNTKDFLEALREEENVNMGFYPYLKSRGKNGGTWMSPVLFIKFAMWINPRFEVQVIRFVYDQMIRFRNEAGDAYREIGSAVQKIVSRKDMSFAMKNIAKAMNFIECLRRKWKDKYLPRVLRN